MAAPSLLSVTVEVTATPAASAAASALGRHRRWGWASLALFLALMSAATLARLTGNYPEPHVVTPHIDATLASQAWFATQNCRVIGQFQGPRTLNVTVVRRDGDVRGDVQNLTADGARQTGYFRFRVRDGVIETNTSGSLAASTWVAASPSQETLVRRITDPQWILAPFLAGVVHYAGQSGDATVYRTPRGDSLYLIDGHPAQVVTHGHDGESRAWVVTDRVP